MALGLLPCVRRPSFQQMCWKGDDGTSSSDFQIISEPAKQSMELTTTPEDSHHSGSGKPSELPAGCGYGAGEVLGIFEFFPFSKSPAKKKFKPEWSKLLNVIRNFIIRNSKDHPMIGIITLHFTSIPQHMKSLMSLMQISPRRFYDCCVQYSKSSRLFQDSASSG